MDIHRIETGHLTDWDAIKTIYIEGIQTGNATFESVDELPTGENWFACKVQGSVYKIIDIDQVILGWSALSSVSDRCIYGGVAEISVYITNSARGKGLGKQLLQILIDFAENNGIWTLQAGIFPENKVSISLHKKLGFRTVGIREKLGKLENRWRDVLLMERRSDTIL